MAIKFEEVHNMYESEMNAPFCPEELSAIEEVEKQIDNKILKDFKRNPVYIDLQYTQFSQFAPRRAGLMSAELEKRYREAGWYCSIEFGEDDGPNRPGQDYFILKEGKK
jgi:hypothetical protein